MDCVPAAGASVCSGSYVDAVGCRRHRRDWACKAICVTRVSCCAPPLWRHSGLVWFGDVFHVPTTTYQTTLIRQSMINGPTNVEGMCVQPREVPVHSGSIAIYGRMPLLSMVNGSRTSVNTFVA